jgi:hypothetical protein
MRIDRTLFAGILLLGIGAPSRARGADAIDACVTATRVGQEQQRAGKLRDARATFVKCDDVSCPSEVRSVCEHLLDVAEASQPSIVLAARDEEGHDLVDVAVAIDGVPVDHALEGKAMDVDPGAHDVRFSARDGRVESLRVIAHEGEKNRTIQVTFRARVPAPNSTPSETPEKQGDSRSPVPVLTYVFGAVGIVALGTFAALAIDGQHRYDDCRDHGCATSTTDGLSLERGIAWTALGVGVVSLGAATIFFIERPTSSGNVSIGMRGSNLIFGGSF